MPYSSVDEVPDYVPKAKRKQWLEVFNSAYGRATGTAKEREASAFAQANAVAGPNAKLAGLSAEDAMNKEAKITQAAANYTTVASDQKRACERCEFFDWDRCKLVEGVIADTGTCKLFAVKAGREVAAESTISVGDSTLRSTRSNFKKFIPFSKVDNSIDPTTKAPRREVWGIVTAEYPDKDDEVCDYETSVPYYKAVVDEMSKATDGRNIFPLRAMHQLKAAGKGIAIDFRSSDKEIFMGFKVVDDEEWKKVDEGVYTGFSQGGSMVKSWPDPTFKGCTRYTANPSEVSLVDNPCLGIAHYTYVKADGTTEMRKVKSVGDPGVTIPRAQFERMEKTVNEVHGALVARGMLKKTRKKRVAGEDLTAGAFLVVGDVEKAETWNLPIEFSDDAKTRRHLRRALARFDGESFASAEEKEKLWKRLAAAAKKNEIDVALEKAKLAAIRTHVRKQCRVRVNRLARRADPGRTLAFLDDHLGSLAKGMYEVSSLAQCVDRLCYMVYAVANEQEWEKDADSPLPAMLGENVNDLLDTLLAMVEEESGEMREDVRARLAAAQ